MFLAGSCALLKPARSSLDGYVGSEACISCHGSRHPKIVHAWKASRHHATMQRVRKGAGGEKTLCIIGRPEGKHVRVRADLRIVPSGGWEEDEVAPPHDVIAGGAKDADAGQQCLGCHSTGYFVSRRAFAEHGVGCEACHGPGQKHADSGGSKESIVSPARLSAARGNMVCGQCHSLGKDRSGAYPFPVTRAGEALAPFQPGQDLTAAFADARPKLVRKGWEYSLFVQAAEKYARQLCTDCHDPHGRPGSPAMLKDPTNEICLRCHGVGRARFRFESHGGVGDVTRKLCWSCHPNAHAH